MKCASLFLCFEVYLYFRKPLLRLYAQTHTTKYRRTLQIKGRGDSFTELVCVSVRLEMRIIIDYDCVLEALNLTSPTCPAGMFFISCCLHSASDV